MMLWIKGLVIGIAVSAPVGPVASLCVRRSLEQGLRAGLLTGMGAVAADMIFALLASLGSAVLFPLVTHYGFWLRLGGGMVMLGMFAVTWRKPPPEPKPTPNWRDQSTEFLSAFAITLSNPFTILGFTAIFAAMGGMDAEHLAIDRAMNLLGIGTGCVLWWGGLAIASRALRHHMDQNHLKILRHIASFLLLIFGVAAIVTSLLGLDL
ncbi:MAG: LysE family transporter [Alphaproteobacteria bacterium]|nr:LysE family transporter [Alphaproteobacteria bacterium]